MSWSTAGLAGKPVNEFLTVDDVLFAACDDGVYYTEDLSEWTELPGARELRPFSLGIEGGDLLVGTKGFGLHRAPLP